MPKNHTTTISMITLIYSGNNSRLCKAVQNANEILSGDAFYEKIAALPEYSPELSHEIATNLKKSNFEIRVVSYRNPFGKKVTKAANPFSFKVNTSRISSVVAFAVHTLIHQAMLNFSVSTQKRRMGYFHFQEQNQKESLPSQLGEIAEIISRRTRRFA